MISVVPEGREENPTSASKQGQILSQGRPLVSGKRAQPVLRQNIRLPSLHPGPVTEKEL